METTTARTGYLIIGLVALALLVGVSLWVWQRVDSSPATDGAALARYAVPGFQVDLETPLVNQHGDPTRFRDFRGRAVLVFFGYTHCPDVCPLTLAEFTQVKAQLGKVASRTVVAFVTVDPTRDTPPVVGRFVANFDPGFVGLTGERAAIDAVAESFNARYRLNDQEDPRQYTVDHTAFSYLLGPGGEVRYLFPLDTAPELIAQAVHRVLGT